MELFQETSADFRPLEQLYLVISQSGHNILHIPNVSKVISQLTNLHGTTTIVSKINYLVVMNESIFTNKISQN
jgi:hypothetical protein